MTTTDWYVVAMGILGIIVWIRGGLSRSVGTCSLAVAITTIAAAVYFSFFSLTRAPFLAAALFLPLLATLPLFRRRLHPLVMQILFGVVLLLTVLSAGYERSLMISGNSLLVIHPYRSGGTWRFDEPQLHLHGEPFVAGVPEMIDIMTQDLPNADDGFRLVFSARQFPGANWRLDLLRSESGGNWYINKKHRIEGWLCPALFKFFPRPPQHIYAKAEAI